MSYLATLPHLACAACGNRTMHWRPRCIACGASHALVRQPATATMADLDPVASGDKNPSSANVWAQVVETPRSTLGLPSVDRLLGGGAVAGSAILLGGQPGIGKSTLLLQCMFALARAGHPVLYASGEEPAAQVAARALRLGYSLAEALEDRLRLVAASSVRDVVEAIEASAVRPRALVVDSVQVMRAQGVASTPGSVLQVREVTRQFIAVAKQHKLTLFLVGHVTKDGVLAGPKTLEHLVDVVLRFEGDPGNPRRTLSTPSKNRFGPTGLRATLEMTEAGLREAPDDRRAASVVVGTPQGAQVVLEVVVRAGIGRRTAVGLELAQLQTAITALWISNAVALDQHDVFVRVRGGGRSVDGELLEAPLVHALEAAATGRPCVREPVEGGRLSLDGGEPTPT